MKLINLLGSLNPFPTAHKAVQPMQIVRPRPGIPSATDVHRRLAHGFYCLETIASQRIAWGNPEFGKDMEERIIWRELRELEQQELAAPAERLDGSESLTPQPRPPRPRKAAD